MTIDAIVNLAEHPITAPDFATTCRGTLDRDGVLVLPDFITPDALASMREESEDGQDRAHFCTQSHSVYLTPTDPALPDDHPANRKVESS